MGRKIANIVGISMLMAGVTTVSGCSMFGGGSDFAGLGGGFGSGGSGGSGGGSGGGGGGSGGGGGGSGGGGGGGSGGSGGGGGGTGGDGDVALVSRTYTGGLVSQAYGPVTGRNTQGGVAAALSEEPAQNILGDPTTKGTIESPSGGDIAQDGSPNIARVEITPLVGPAKSNVARGGVKTDYVEGTTTLSFVDYEYVRSGVVVVLPVQDGDGAEANFYGAKPGSGDRPTSLSSTASYQGPFGGTMFANGDRFALGGAGAELDADFDSGTVTGKITAPFFVSSKNPASPDPETFDILLENGTITGPDFAGDARVVSTGTNTTLVDTSGGRGDFQGGFFGPNGEETAGLVDIQGTQTGVGDVDIIGGFFGNKLP